MRALLALLVVFFTSVPAGANTNDVGVVVVGEVTMQPQLAAHLETWLRQHGHQVSLAPLPPDAINTLQDCFVMEDEVCARTVIDNRAKTQSVVFARVDLKHEEGKPDRVVTLTAYWFDKGRDAIAERRFCERCNDITLRSTADELMAALTASTAKHAGKLKLSSTPAGARVLINGNPIGVTPLEFDLKTGTHKLTLQRADHRPETRDVTIRRGETTELDVMLQSEVSRNFFPIIFLGTGGTLLATGIVLFAIDEDEPSPTGPQKQFYRNTATLGVGLAASGVVVGGIGAYLLFRGKRSSTPVAAITSDSSYIGWAGQF